MAAELLGLWVTILTWLPGLLILGVLVAFTGGVFAVICRPELTITAMAEATRIVPRYLAFAARRIAAQTAVESERLAPDVIATVAVEMNVWTADGSAAHPQTAAHANSAAFSLPAALLAAWLCPRKFGGH